MTLRSVNVLNCPHLLTGGKGQLFTPAEGFIPRGDRKPAGSSACKSTHRYRTNGEILAPPTQTQAPGRFFDRVVYVFSPFGMCCDIVLTMVENRTI